jgi:hypothetical protein
MGLRLADDRLKALLSAGLKLRAAEEETYARGGVIRLP